MAHRPLPAAYVFLSHTHIDHVLGLCFFEPLLTAAARTFILGPGATRGALTRSLRHLTNSHLVSRFARRAQRKKRNFLALRRRDHSLWVAGHPT